MPTGNGPWAIGTPRCAVAESTFAVASSLAGGSRARCGVAATDLSALRSTEEPPSHFQRSGATASSATSRPVITAATRNHSERTRPPNGSERRSASSSPNAAAIVFGPPSPPSAAVIAAPSHSVHSLSLVISLSPVGKELSPATLTVPQALSLACAGRGRSARTTTLRCGRVEGYPALEIDESRVTRLGPLTTETRPGQPCHFAVTQCHEFRRIKTVRPTPATAVVYG